MANGDIAAAAGVPIVPSSAQRSMGYDEINRSLDLTVTRASRAYLGITVSPTAPGSPIVNHLWFKPVA